MYQISNEKFGLFVTELRKEKNLTQKDLAEKLYVSDKTVSKWERGLSMPNVVLLIPIADILDVTVTELLRGKKRNNVLMEQYTSFVNRLWLLLGSGMTVQTGIRQILSEMEKDWLL